MLATGLPGRRAAKIPPVAAMSSVHAKATTKSLVVRNTIGALFAAAGTAVVLYATTLDGSDGQTPMGFGTVLLIIGAFVLTPLLSRPLIAAAAPALRVFGVSGRLARQNSVRNPRRTAATASALMIGLTLITGMTVTAGSLQTAINKMASDGIRADYVVSMANGNFLSPDLEKKLAATDGVTATSPLRNALSRIDGETEFLTGVNGATIGDLTDLKVDSGAFEVGGTDVVVDGDTAESLVISLFGGVPGIGPGVFFGWAAGELLAGRMATYELVLPWTRMAFFLLLAAAVGVLAALWPARRAARLNMLTAIKSE